MEKVTQKLDETGNLHKTLVIGMLPLSESQIERESIKFAKWIRKGGWVIGDKPDRDYSEEDLMEIYKDRKR